MIQRLRRLQQTEFSRIEHDLTITRLSEVILRSVNSYSRGVIGGDSMSDAIIYEGLVAAFAGNMDVSVSVPAAVVQYLPCGNVIYAIDANDGNEWVFTIDAAHPTLDRYDIIEGQIRCRDAYNDTSVDVIDPTTRVITPMVRPRDKEYYLYLRVNKGTDGAPPNSPTAGTSGQVVGSVEITTVDLSSQYILKLAIGHGVEFVEVDCRGATPSATTRAEIIAKINSAGFGTIADSVGNYIRITAPDSGENSVVIFRQPVDTTKDALTTILGIATTPGYYITYQGENPYFKIAEIFVEHAITVLDDAHIRDRNEKSTWVSDGDTITNSFAYEAHRQSVPMDHADESVEPRHLSDEVKTFLKNKLTIYEPASKAIIYQAISSRHGRVHKTDYPTCDRTGEENDFGAQEQMYPRSRLDQRQEVWNVGDYNTLTTVNEGVLHRIPFTPSNSAQVLSSLRHQRAGFYVKVIGSGYERLTAILHNSADVELARYSWNIADLIVGWVYFDLPASLQDGETYHYHVISENLSGGSTATLGADGSANIAFRELYRPLGGKFGSANSYDVIHVLTSGLAEVVSVNPATVDDIVVCGDGYSSETAIDYMAVDFSVVDWATWSYNNYFGIDLKTGRIRFPASIPEDVTNTFVTFNTVRVVDDVSTKELYKFGTVQTLEDYSWVITKNVSSGGTILRDELQGVRAIILTGTLTANVTLTMPLGHEYDLTILNKVTGNYYITVGGTSGATFKIRGGTGVMYHAMCDGSNWYEENGGNGDMTITSTQWITLPAGRKNMLVTLVGGGGGGGGGYSSSWNLGGGGGGRGAVIVRKIIIEDTQLYAIVGAGGAGGTTNSYTGVGGGYSSLRDVSGKCLIAAQGGSGGGCGFYISPVYSGNGGGGANGYGDFEITGYPTSSILNTAGGGGSGEPPSDTIGGKGGHCGGDIGKNANQGGYAGVGANGGAGAPGYNGYGGGGNGGNYNQKGSPGCAGAIWIKW